MKGEKVARSSYSRRKEKRKAKRKSRRPRAKICRRDSHNVSFLINLIFKDQSMNWDTSPKAKEGKGRKKIQSVQ